METKKIELNTPLDITEIDFRVQSISAKGWVTILAYKDARVDMKRLNDVCGPLNWQKKYQVVNGNLFCSVGIFNESIKEWVWKEDVGTESQTEKVKGQASDAFKRSCFNWGIGIELYSYPRIFLQLKANEFAVKDYNGKKIGTSTFDLKLSKWKWDLTIEDGEVKQLTGKDQDGNIRFDSDKDFNSAPTGNAPAKTPEVKEPVKQLLTEKGYTYLMSEGTWQEIVKALSNRMIKAAWKKELEKRFATIEPPKKGSKEKALAMREQEAELSTIKN